MRIYFTPNGVGLGHIRRTEAIAKYLGEEGHTYVFSTYLDGLDYARKKGLNVIPTIPLSYRNRPDGAIDYKATVAFSGLSLGVRRFLLHLLKEIQNIKRFKPDLIFSDSRASPLIAGRMLGVPSILLLNQFKVEIMKKPETLKMNIWDRIFFLIANSFWVLMRTILTWIWGLSQVILIPDYSNPLTISIANMVIPRRYLGKVRYLGPILEEYPENLPEKNILRRRFNFEAEAPLIYGAVSGPKLERRILSKKLEAVFSAHKGRYQFILTKGEHDERGSKRKGRLLSFSWVDEKTHYEILKACDIVACRAGHGIITKAMAYGKPMILIPIPDHSEQISNAQRAAKIGFAQILDQNTLDSNALEGAVEKICDGEARSSMEQAKIEASHLNALETVKQKIVDINNLFSK